MQQYTKNIRTIAIGSFDGIHVAHQKLIDQADGVVVIERGQGYLTPGYRRSWYTEKPLFFYLFDWIKNLSAAQFVAWMERDFPQLERIVVGYDFEFGQGREGDAMHLESLFDGEVVIVDEVTLEGISVHSRVIRESLRFGDIASANRLLGRTYCIDAEVIAGQGLGGRELVPTLNLSVRNYQLPREGVYATRTRVRGVWLPSVSFIGHRVSTDGSFAVETHVIDQDIGVTAGRVQVAFVGFIRNNRRFEGLEALKDQIGRDISRAKSMTI